MKKFLLVLFALITAVPIHAQYGGIQVDKYIQDAGVFSENQLPFAPTLIPFTNIAEAKLRDVKSSGYYQSLNGIWKFQFQNTPYTFPADVYKKEFNDAQWNTISVPSVWQLQGYDHMMYRNIPMEFTPYDPPKVPTKINPSGCYRRVFTVKPDWKDRKIILHFDGVKSNAFVWINGTYAGYDEGGMTPAEFDITKLLREGENQITVMVNRWCSGSYLEDQDMWRYSGIFRDVYVYAKSKTSITDLTIVTDFDETYTYATLALTGKISAESDAALYKVQYALIDSNGNEILRGSNGISTQGSIEVSEKVNRPEAWSDEKPYLYTLLLSLADKNGTIIEVLKKKVGFREIVIKDGRICLNGKPVYFRGVNRHEHHPRFGGAITRDVMMQDILLMKQNNINAVRSSHYPDTPEWLDLCDEFGILIQDEVNAECHYTENSFPFRKEFHEAFMDRFIGMIQRDKNHPCVVMWSTGNECGLGDIHYRMNEYARQADKTRLVMHQSNYPDGDAPYADVSGQRYPTPARLRHIGLTTAKPVVLGEYEHAMGNSVGHFDEIWNLMYTMPKLQGGFIWDWVDQGTEIPLQLTPDLGDYRIKSAVMGRPQSVTGVKGKAFKFSGLDDWIEVYNHPVLDSITDNISISFWVQGDEWFTENPLVTRANQFGITQRYKDSVSFYLNSYQNAVTVAVPDDWRTRWHFVTAEFDGKTMKLRIDSNSTAQKEYRSRLGFTRFPVNIARDRQKNTDQHLGWIANCAIDEVVISANKKQLLYLPFDVLDTNGTFAQYGASSFVCNGIICYNRIPQPELFQVKKSQSPIRFSLDRVSRTLTIKNMYHSTELSEFTFAIYGYKNGKQIHYSTVAANAAPLDSTHIPLNFAFLNETDGDIILEVAAVWKKNPFWYMPGHEAAFEQFELTRALNVNNAERRAKGLKLYETGNNIEMQTKTALYMVDTKTGTLTVQQNALDKKLLVAGLQLNAWRAPTSNEKVDWGKAEADAWFASGLNRLQLDTVTVTRREYQDSVIIDVRQAYRLAENEDYILNNCTYSIYASGESTVQQKVQFMGYFDYSWLPAVGMKFTLDSTCHTVTWYGRGPFETYPDRKTGAKVGLYQLSADSFYVPYVEPEDCGNRTDVRWVQFSDANGNGIAVNSSTLFNFSVARFKNMHRAVYPFQLQAEDRYQVAINYAITGVGDTPVPVMPQYRVYPKDVDFTIHLIPVAGR